MRFLPLLLALVASICQAAVPIQTRPNVPQENAAGTKDVGIGNSPLHWACLNNDVALVASLISKGAAVNQQNAVQATPLIYGAGNLEIVRLLVAHGADVNHASKFKSTPLHVAARHPQSIAIIKYLLDHDANSELLDGGGSSVLDIAAQSGDVESVKLLLKRGLKPGNLSGAAMYGHYEIVEHLLAAEAPINQAPRFAGHALNFALYGQQSEIAQLLVAHGADLTLRSPSGQHETPPMLWAAYNEHLDASVAQEMINRGADVNQLSSIGESALDWAIERNNAPLETLLRESGGKLGTSYRKEKALPNNPLPKTIDSLNPLIRNAASKAIRLLQKSSDTFLKSPLVKRQQCVSCHQQTLPAIALAWARKRGIPSDETSIARQIQNQIKFWSKNEKIEKSYELIRPQPDTPVLLGYGLLGLSSLGYPNDTLTEAMTRYLLNTQQADGSWPAADFRPPMEDGPIQGTAFAIASLKGYPVRKRAKEIESAIYRARTYLEHSRPRSFNQEVFQILGLTWSGLRNEQLKSRLDALVSKQQSDGGWAPLQGLASDAWASAQALVTIAISSDIGTDSETFQSGVRYLLRTQFPDGSWYVRSRSWPFQPHFESGFPHGKDQWISAGATAWAVMALVQTQARQDSVPQKDWMSMTIPKIETKDELTVKSVPIDRPTTSYQRDIQPILERSCGDCHGAQATRQKGSFSIVDRSSIQKGGQSNKPVVISGNSDASDLILMITDQIEDLEMPPLSKRQKSPALTAEEVRLLRTWIDEGIPE